MDKHAMLYPELQPNSSASADQRALASNAMGLPTEPRDLAAATTGSAHDAHEPNQPPPSYDVAVSIVGSNADTNLTDNWYNNQAGSGNSAAAAQHIMQNQPFARNEINTRSFVEPSLPAVNVITQQHFPKLGPHPCTVFCPSCGTARMTRMAFTPNTRTHFCALLLCLVGCCCCACFVPYCTNSCRTGNHYCAVCNTFLGSYNAQDTI